MKLSALLSCFYPSKKATEDIYEEPIEVPRQVIKELPSCPPPLPDDVILSKASTSSLGMDQFVETIVAFGRKEMVHLKFADDRTEMIQKISKVSPFQDMIINNLILKGKIDDVICSSFSSAQLIGQIRFEGAKVSCCSSTMSHLLRNCRVNAVSFVNCEFDDAQTICDEVFIENRQLKSLRIIVGNGCRQSHPLLTDRLLHCWAELPHPPSYVLLSNIQTSFTAKAVKTLIQVARLSPIGVSWSLGRIANNAPISRRVLSQLPPDVQLIVTGNRFTVVREDARPMFLMFFSFNHCRDSKY